MFNLLYPLRTFCSFTAVIILTEACSEHFHTFYVENSEQHENVVISKLPATLHLDCLTSSWNYTTLTWTPKNLSMTEYQIDGNNTVVFRCVDTPQTIHFTCHAYNDMDSLARSIRISVRLAASEESLKYLGLIIGFSVCGCLLLMSITIVQVYHWWNHGFSVPWSHGYEGPRQQKGGNYSSVDDTDGRKPAGNFILQTFNQRRQNNQQSGSNAAYYSSGQHGQGSKRPAVYEL